MGAQQECFADALREVMRLKQHTPRLLAERTDIPEDTIKTWLKGRGGRVREWQRVVCIAAALELPMPEARRLLLAAGAPLIEIRAAALEPWLATLGDEAVRSMVLRWVETLAQAGPAPAFPAVCAAPAADAPPQDPPVPQHAPAERPPATPVSARPARRAGPVLLLLGLAALALGLGVAALGPGALSQTSRFSAPSAAPLPTPTCSGEGCTGLDPDQTGCTAGASTVASAALDGAVQIELRWSEVCKVNWARIVSLVPDAGTVQLYLQIKDPHDRPIHPRANLRRVDLARETSAYTSQWYAPTGAVYVSACAARGAEAPGGALSSCTAFK